MLDHIREQSNAGCENDISIVDILLDSNWCYENDLNIAYNVLQESPDVDHAIIFFQLPFEMLLPQEWINLKTMYIESKIRFRVIGANNNTINPSANFTINKRRNYYSLEDTTNAYLPDDHHGFLVRTQVMILYPVSGKRQLFYENYLEQIDRNLPKSILVPAEKNTWSEHPRPLNAMDYERDLLRRLKLETLYALKEFMPIYSVNCNAPYARAPRDLNNLFMMVQNGRFVTLGPGKSFVAEHAKSFTFNDYSANLAKLNNKLDQKVAPSIYEQYLLEAVREVDHGSYNLAIVHTVMILEWFVNEIIDDKIVSVIKKSLSQRQDLSKLTTSKILHEWSASLHEKYQKYMQIAGIKLDKKLLKELKLLIELRNRIVHKEQAQAVSKEIALKSIETGMNVIQQSMRKLRELSVAFNIK